jgi:PBSX family phage portal protein
MEPTSLASAVAPAAEASPAVPGIQAFTFGDPEPVLQRGDILDYIECWMNGRWYEPPVSWDGLAKSFRANPHHTSSIYFKRNVLASLYKPHPLLTREAFGALVLDYLTFGNAYLEKRSAISRKALQLRHALAKYVRRGADLESYWFVRGWKDEHEFEPRSVWHLREPDINQEVYGLPEYLSALQAAWLNESATLFRRRYYNNGSHAGFIMYVSDQAQQQEDIDKIRQALRDSKGPGNFRNLFYYAPGGKADGIKLIPVSEVAAKDEFFNIKAVSRDDVLAAHRIPPQLLGIVPSNAGGFGDVEKAAQVFVLNELTPLQNRLRELNDWLGEEVIQFTPYVVGQAAPGGKEPSMA